ncbi:MAG: hypothetical protein JWQ42_3920 [Edaphobacter sp.]|nr:hypothetical protein [Edaphobacter sp.]
MIFAEKNYEDRSGEPILCPIREAAILDRRRGSRKISGAISESVVFGNGPDFREGYLDANTFADGGNEHVCGARPGGSESHNKGTKAQATKSIAAVPKRHKHKATEGAIYERST